jgi:hypothetical protein
MLNKNKCLIRCNAFGCLVVLTLVFHRILDFKTGLDFYPGPFFCPWGILFHFLPVILLRILRKPPVVL